MKRLIRRFSDGVILRRSVFYVPGSDERKLTKATSLNADCIVYDLEDGVSLNRKEAARENILKALENDSSSSEKCVRINHIGSGLEFHDLLALLPSMYLQCIVIPKIQSASDIHFVATMVNSLAPKDRRNDIRYIACIESAEAMMNIKAIANAHKQVSALLFAAEDYCADLNLTRTDSRKELLFARSTVVTAAKAYGLDAIDLVCIDYKNMETLADECIEGMQMGFTGKQAIHPNQVELINKHFAPSLESIDKAERIVNENMQKGIGAFQVDGKVVDMPVIKWAQGILKQAKVAGLKK